MKKDIIVNGSKVGEVGNPIDFVIASGPIAKKSKFDKEIEEQAKQIHEKNGKKADIKQNTCP